MNSPSRSVAGGGEFLAEVVATGKWCGLGVGSEVADWDARITGVDFVDVGRRVERGLFRRDYGLVEVLFTGGDPWVCDSFAIQVHRLAHRPTLLSEWPAVNSAEVPAITWDEVRKALELRPDAPAWAVGRQHDMLQYMSDDLGVSVFVHDEEDDDAFERTDDEDEAEGPSRGDLWSVTIGPPGPQITLP